MSQISLYMNENVMGLLRDRSHKEGLSISKYVTRLIEDHVAGKQDAWPSGYWDNVYGCLSAEDAKAMRSVVTEPNGVDDLLDDSCNWFKESEPKPA